MGVLVGLLIGLLVGTGIVLLVSGWQEPTRRPALTRKRRPRTPRVSRRLLRARAEAWPDVVDNIASAVRAGMSLPEALIAIGERGPEVLREPFVSFGRDYAASGRFGDGLDALKSTLADPTGDRVVEALRIAREVGGGDLGRLLRTLSSFLRDDLRTRAELEARQSWTVSAARLAAAAPWVVLVLVASQPSAARSYASSAGVTVIVVGGLLSFAGYRIMLRLGRLPVERRVLA